MPANLQGHHHKVSKRKAAQHHIPGVVTVMNNKQATAFDSRYADYDLMILVAGNKKDVIASLQMTQWITVNGQRVATRKYLGDDIVIDGDIVDHDVVQIDKFSPSDYRLVFFKHTDREAPVINTKKLKVQFV